MLSLDFSVGVEGECVQVPNNGICFCPAEWVWTERRVLLVLCHRLSGHQNCRKHRGELSNIGYKSWDSIINNEITDSHFALENQSLVKHIGTSESAWEKPHRLQVKTSWLLQKWRTFTVSAYYQHCWTPLAPPLFYFKMGLQQPGLHRTNKHHK